MPKPSDNLKPVQDAIEKGMNDLDKIDEKRGLLNAEKAVIVERLESMGVNRHAVKAARQFRKLEEGKRQGYDLSYELARRAIGRPWQPDMLHEADKGDDAETSGK